MIQNAGALQLSGKKPSLLVGDESAPAVLTFSGSGDNAGTLNSSGASAHIFPNGTLQIAGGDSITISGPVSLLAGSASNFPGGTINVTNGALGIGSMSGAIQQGWVTVASGGILSGGLICPPQGSIEDTACIPNSLVGQGTVNGSVVNEGGTVLVDPAILNITQGFQQTGGTLALEIDGTQSAQVSQVSAGGAIQITGGTVEGDRITQVRLPRRQRGIPIFRSIHQRRLELIEPSRHRSVRFAASGHISQPGQRQTPMTRLRPLPTGDRNGLRPNPRSELLSAYLQARQRGEGP